MRILVISNLYPPHYVGGYELACYDVVNALRHRGHEIGVLTSKYGVGKRRSDGHVHRWLEQDFLRVSEPQNAPIGRLFREEVLNQAAFSRIASGLRPHIVFVWNPTFISIALVETSRRAGIPVCFYVSDDWLARWSENSDPWLRYWARRPKRLLSRIGKPVAQSALNGIGVPTSMKTPEGDQFCFASEYLRESALRSGKPTINAEVIYHGINETVFSYTERQISDPCRLLYVGQVVPHKGVHTAIRAMSILRDQGADVQLDVVGTSIYPDYIESLQQMVQSENLQDGVRFCGFVDRSMLADVYREHEVLVFPSIWDEPFSIVLLEAMASGLPVVGTATGGSPEVLRNEINGLVFQKESPDDCAKQIRRLLGDPALYARLSKNAGQTVREQFRFEDMVDRIERWLLRRTSSPA